MLNIFTRSLIVDSMPLLLHNCASQCVIFTVCTAMNALQCRNVHTRFRKNQSTVSNFVTEHTLITGCFFSVFFFSEKRGYFPYTKEHDLRIQLSPQKIVNASSHTEKSIDFFRKTTPVYSENFTTYVKIVCEKNSEI